MEPPRPARTPHPRSLAAGPPLPKNGATTARPRRPVRWAPTTTVTAGTRRAAMPPAKSPTPKITEDRAARRRGNQPPVSSIRLPARGARSALAECRRPAAGGSVGGILQALRERRMYHESFDQDVDPDAALGGERQRPDQLRGMVADDRAPKHHVGRRVADHLH